MNLEQTKKELLELVKKIKEHREQLKKQIENDNIYFTDILEKIDKIKSIDKYIEKLESLEKGITTDFKNFKLTYQNMEERTENQVEQLEQLENKFLKNKDIKKDIFTSLKKELLKDNKNSLIDTMFKSVVIITLIFSMYNSFKISKNKVVISRFINN